MTVARSIADRSVTGRLVACANLFPGMTSVYRWEGEIESSEEVVAIFKTSPARVEQVIAEVERLHPYDVPALVHFTCAGGSAEFLAWIREETA